MRLTHGLIVLAALSAAASLPTKAQDAPAPQVATAATSTEEPVVTPAEAAAATSRPSPIETGANKDAAPAKPPATAVVNASPLTLDAAPSPEDQPDPLTPPDTPKGPALAPGAPVRSATTAQPAGPIAADAVVTAVRARLAEGTARLSAADREDRAALAGFYEQRATAAWTASGTFTPHARAALAEIADAASWGLRAEAFELPALGDGTAATDVQLADAEIKLGLAVLKYARHARGGRADPPSISRLLDRRPQMYEPRSLIEAMVASADASIYLRSLHPQHAPFQKLREALVAARANGTSVGGRDTTQRLVVNMEKWRWMPDDLGQVHVIDAVPEQVTRVYQDGREVLSEKIVVGKPSSPTPMFSANMLYVIFHPSWGVPDGIKTQELWPQLRRASTESGGWFSSAAKPSDVLRAHGLNVSAGGGPINPDSINWAATDIRRFSFTQPPGPKNVLGNVKFRFPNKHDVYMHDTPERHLFNGGKRAFSHGCMRVQNPIHLAEVLLGADKGWSAEKVRQLANHGGGDITLTTPIPVHITYFTAVASADGVVREYPDLYGLDSRIATAIEGRNVSIASARGSDDVAPTTGRRSRTRGGQSANLDGDPVTTGTVTTTAADVDETADVTPRKRRGSARVTARTKAVPGPAKPDFATTFFGR